MTRAEWLTEYANAASGAFRNQLERLIKSLTMRTLATDLSDSVVFQEDLGLNVVKDAAGVKSIAAGGTYVHAGAGATYTLDDGINRLYFTNDSTSTDLLVIKDSGATTIWALDPGQTAMAYWDGDKYQWK